MDNICLRFFDTDKIEIDTSSRGTWMWIRHEFGELNPLCTSPLSAQAFRRIWLSAPRYPREG